MDLSIAHTSNFFHYKALQRKMEAKPTQPRQKILQGGYTGREISTFAEKISNFNCKMFINALQ
jgi:hypothetical protein